MKILHVIPNLQIGGAQRLIIDLSIAQKKLGDVVEILTYQCENTYFEELAKKRNIKLIYLDIIPDKGHISIIRNLKHKIKNYDVIHVHLFPALYHVAIATLGMNKTLVYTEHSTHNRRRDISILQPVEKFIYNKYQAIVAISDATKETLSEWLGAKYAEKIHVISNGVPVQNEPTSDLSSTEKIILMISRFEKAKDQKTVIDSIPYVKDKNIKFVFAGDGSLLSETKEYAKSKGMDERCEFPGSVLDIDFLIKKSILGVQSSHWEGFGLTALEFMKMGVPIIGSDVAGLKDVISDAGIIFPTQDAKALGNSINKLLEDPNLYEEYKLKGLKRAMDFSIDKTAEKLENLYRSII